MFLWRTNERTVVNNNMIGADVEDLRALARLFQKYATALDQTSHQLNSAIMPSRWNGPDAERFRQDWTSRIRPRISSAGAMFTDTSQKLQAQAQDQEMASAAIGSGDSSGAHGGAGGNSTNAAPSSSLQQELEELGDHSEQETLQWWNNLSQSQKSELLKGADENGISNAYYLAALEGRLPQEAQEAVRETLMEGAKASIPMYSQSDKIGVDGQIAWVHGGAHLSSGITQNADGTASLTLAGDLSGGVNTPSTKAGVDVTMSGEVSQTYEFASLQDALAARDEMLNSLPPDSMGRASDAVSDPGAYIQDTLNGAAENNNSTDQYTSAKGTLSIGGSVALSDAVSAGARLDLAYEQNLSTGTSTASATASVNAQLDLGDGLSFGGEGEASFKLSMDKDGDIKMMTVDLKGTIEGSSNVQANPNTPDPMAELLGQKPPSEGPSASSSGGIQGTAQLQMQYTPENQHIIDSYLNNVANDHKAAAAADLQRIFHASGVTLQANSVVSTESNLVDFDSGLASIKIGGSSETSINAGTVHKTPYDEKYEGIRGQTQQ